jgi:hypothetical protein
MNEEDLIKLAQKIMASSPGMSPQEALENAKSIMSGQRDQPPGGPPAGIKPYSPGPSYGTLPGDKPRAVPGLFGPGGFQQQGRQPQQRQQPRGMPSGPAPGMQRQQPGGMPSSQGMQRQQRPPVGVEQLCAASGGTLSGGMCHYSTPF